ncbi:hypothetical protein PVK06_048698 [Gossypium arboreum]|uniref:Uncharacterized protein n=1 Tax=Gossypium arboreum TaxID=29729 RepID=A0ABR0MH61_GOSAR|nr:hypothetical protein PVK06_048698 [Gossypium arboreum]
MVDARDVPDGHRLRSKVRNASTKSTTKQVPTYAILWASQVRGMEGEYEDAEEEGEEPAHAYNLDNAFLPKQASVGGSNFATRAKAV